MPKDKSIVVVPDCAAVTTPTNADEPTPVRFSPLPYNVAVTIPTFKFGVPERPVAVPEKLPIKLPAVVTPDTSNPPGIVTFSVALISCAFC